MNQLKPGQISQLGSIEHRDWLTEHREALLGFFQSEVVLPGAGYVYLGSRDHALPRLGPQLWLGARVPHCFSIMAMQGRPGAEDVARHGIGFYLNGTGCNTEYGRWFPTVGGDSPSFRKELYRRTHILSGINSTTIAGISGGEDLFAVTLEVIERFQVEADGTGTDVLDHELHRAEPYRGQNVSVHLTEVYLAAHKATGDKRLLERTTRIACRIAGWTVGATEGAWRLLEHFDAAWRELPDHSRDGPQHPFRSCGSQPGHRLEWSKLLLQIRGLEVRGNWLLDASRHLFNGAFQDVRASNGGFCCTAGWDGKPVVPERFFWEVAGGIRAATGLFHATGEQCYEDAYRILWAYANEHVISHTDGSWWQELGMENHPVARTWEGKPDLYHAYRVTFYVLLPENRGITA